MKRRLIVLGVVLAVFAGWIIVSLYLKKHHPRPRLDFSAIVLNDGKVLLAGGDCVIHHLSWLDFLPLAFREWWWDRHRIYDYFPPRDNVSNCDLFDPKTETWTATGDLAKPDSHMSLVLLKNGAVLGIGPSGITQIYESGRWRFIRDLGPGYAGAPLPSGEVLFVSDKKCQIYNPETDRWRITAFSRCSAPFVQTLKDGRVMAVDDTSSNNAMKYFDPQHENWGTFRFFPGQKWASFAHTLLPDGRLFICGMAQGYYGSIGYDGPDEPTAVFIDVRDKSWHILEGMPASLPKGVPIALQDGRVLVVTADGDAPSSFLYDPKSNRWSPTGLLQHPEYVFTMVLLRDGRVLAVECNVTEIYDPNTGKWRVVQEKEK